ncbi:YlbG family protein [Vagococcus allomyrinae]|uniref:YlbG family protein n=1 Tax=Vagococcus allomyrinae TaxID=2794353 RepID=UPI0032215B61
MSDNIIEKSLTFKVIPRRSLIVWVYSLRQLKVLKRYGTISHVSRKMKYVVIYMDEIEVEKNVEALNKLHFVRSVERSYRPDIAMDFGKRVGTDEALKEDDGFEIEELSATITLVEEV